MPEIVLTPAEGAIMMFLLGAAIVLTILPVFVLTWGRDG